MKNTKLVSAIISILVFTVAFLYASLVSAEEKNITDPSMNPVTIIQQQKILLVDDVLEETRTFRYAAGVAGGVFGGVAGATAAAASGTAVVPMVVGGAIVYGAAFYGASTLGVELAYQVTADKIREKRDQAIAEAKKKGEELLEQGKQKYQEKKDEIKEWF